MPLTTIFKKIFSFLMWALAGAIVIPSAVIAYFFFEKWISWFENL